MESFPFEDNKSFDLLDYTLLYSFDKACGEDETTRMMLMPTKKEMVQPHEYQILARFECISGINLPESIPLPKDKSVGISSSSH